MSDDPIDKIVVDMIILCFRCGYKHIDAPDPSKGWENPPHKSHVCRYCCAVFRPADICTNGVDRIKTRGVSDTVFTPGSM